MNWRKRVEHPDVASAVLTLTEARPDVEVPALPGRRVLITGATGFIGGHVAERLIRGRSKVRLVVRRPDRAEAFHAAGAEIRRGDLTNSSTLRGCCDDIEIVLHCGAWLGTPYDRAVAYAVNVGGTTALAEEALRAGVRRFVHLSSVAVYGPVRSGIVTEKSPPWKGVHLYGDSKIDGETALAAVASRGLPTVVTRPGIVYGPRSRGATIQLVRLINRGWPAMVAGGYGYSRPIFVENLVDALVLCSVKPVTGKAFTLIDANVRWRVYLAHYGRMVGKTPRSVPFPVAWLLAVAFEARGHITRRPPRIWRKA
ncbi:MAG: NAD-dependent epimerase/dehydratase family protein, partial [bacterium]